MTTLTTLETPVLIVGGGPVGLSTALNLADQGVESILVEKHPTTATHPKASYFNVRTMEILQQLGIADELYATALLAAGVSFYTNLSGYRLGAITGADMPDYVASVLASTARPGCVSSQIVLESILKDHADRHPKIRVLFDHEKVALEQDDTSVRTKILNRVSGESFIVESEYTIACDGVHSSIREELGAAMIGPPAFGHMINIYIEADIESLVPDQGQALYWIASPRAPGVFIGLGGDGKHWCFNTPYLPERGERAEDFDEALCLEKVHAALGTDELAVEILAVAPWELCGQVVDRYRVGRVFFGGDAAHLNIPTGGFGFNTGMQETHNLAWKLAAVLGGWAPDRLLDTYHEERRPIAVFNVEASHENALRIRETGASLGELTPDVDEVDLDSPRGAAQRERLSAAIAAQRSHFLFLGQEIGFDYASASIESDGKPDTESGPGIIVPDGTPHYVEEHGVADPIFTYIPNARPGARAPHCWLARSGEDEPLTSTLDFFNRKFVLLVAGDSSAWSKELETASSTIPLRVESIGAPGSGSEWHDVGSNFQTCYGLEEGGAVLVRPDGHVAWRAQVEPGRHSQVPLVRALEIAVGRQLPEPLNEGGGTP